MNINKHLSQRNKLTECTTYHLHCPFLLPLLSFFLNKHRVHLSYHQTSHHYMSHETKEKRGVKEDERDGRDGREEREYEKEEKPFE